MARQLGSEPPDELRLLGAIVAQNRLAANRYATAAYYLGAHADVAACVAWMEAERAVRVLRVFERVDRHLFGVRLDPWSEECYAALDL